MPYDLLFRTKFIRIAFKVFFNSTLRKWTLESLTIGPLLHRTDHAFWNDAFQNFPAVPHLKELTIIYCCKHDYVFDMGPWPYFNAFFCRVALFPQYMHVDLQVTINSAPLNFIQGAQLATVLLQLRSCQRVTFWGRRKWYFFLLRVIALTRLSPKASGIKCGGGSCRSNPYPTLYEDVFLVGWISYAGLGYVAVSWTYTDQSIIF